MMRLKRKICKSLRGKNLHFFAPPERLCVDLPQTGREVGGLRSCLSASLVFHQILYLFRTQAKLRYGRSHWVSASLNVPAAPLHFISNSWNALLVVGPEDSWQVPFPSRNMLNGTPLKVTLDYQVTSVLAHYGVQLA